MTENSEVSIRSDVSKITSISIIPTILEVVCTVTGMGFAAVARVTPDTWMACEVLDKIRFGLRSGGELKIDTTICHEIRQSGNSVVIDHVTSHEFYATHHTPALYGFQSYISVPVSRRDGNFFGTLCAIDPSPAILNTPAIISLFKTYAELISFHLNALETLPEATIAILEERTAVQLKRQLNTLKEADISQDKRSKEFTTLLEETTLWIRELIGFLKASANH